MRAGRPTYLWAAESVLRRHRRPLKARDIVTYAQDEGLFSDEMNSRTPQKSLQARLSMDIVRRGQQSIFVRTGRGKFFLRDLLNGSEIDGGDLIRHAGSGARLKPYTTQPRAPAAPSENVLVIPKSAYERLLDFQGFRADDGSLVRKLLAGSPMYLPRTTAENTSEYKQVVTYVIVTHRSKVLAFRRGVFSHAASFLRGSSCIGFGGHVTEDDRTLFSASDAGIVENALRELQEEISIDHRFGDAEKRRIRISGLVNDDSSEVGRRHVAVVMRYKIGNWKSWRKPARGEASVNQLHWIDLNADLVNLTEYEYWSQICWRHFFPRIVRAQPGFRLIRKKPFKGKHIIAVVGGIGSGKSSVTRHFVEELGYAEVNSGRVLGKLMGLRPVPSTSRSLFQKRAWKFVQADKGIERFTAALLAAADETKSGKVVIDGIRQRQTLLALKELAPVPIAVLFVHASPDLAYELYARRQHKGGKPVQAREFLDLLTADTERDVPHLIADADAVLYNWSGEADLKAALSEMARELGLQPQRKR